MKISSHSNIPAPLSRIMLEKMMNMTLKNCPKIMMIPVEKLSLVGNVISAPKSTAITMLGMLAIPIKKQRTEAMIPLLKENRLRKPTIIMKEKTHCEIIAFLYAYVFVRM
jgi:hypothetical protein